ncbi:MAG: choice-of-anchor D domain-containing protein [Pseudomonadota bacterium]
MSCASSFAAAQLPDVIATKTNDTGGVALIDTPFTWTIVMENIGSGDYILNGGFTGLRDDLPNTNMSYGSPTVSYAGGTTQTITCRINSFRLNCEDNDFFLMPPGGSFTVSFTATSSVAQTLDNPRTGGICRADAGNENSESNESNNDCANTVVVGTGAVGPDLTVSKTNPVSGSTELAAGAFDWTLTVANGGDEDATFSSGQTILSDNLPNIGVSYGTPSVGSLTGVSGSGTINCAIAGFNLNCTASGGTVVLADVSGGFQVTVPTMPTAPGSLVNPRSGGSCAVDPANVISEGDEANNDCADTVTVAGSPDLIVSKINDVAGAAEVGVPFNWTIVVSNTGSANYEQNGSFSVLRDELPNVDVSYGSLNVSYAGGTTTNLNCSLNAFVLNCEDVDNFSMPPGGSFTVTVPVTSTAAQTLDNPRTGGVCRVGGEDAETDTSNNNCSDSVVVTTGAIGPDLTISKNNSVSGETELASGSFDWTLSVANGGDEDASFSSGQTIVVDNLPDADISYGTPVVDSITNVSGTGTIGCAINGSDLSCTATGGTVVIGDATGGFAVTIPATPTAANTFANPRSAGSCAVDPAGVITEGDEGNNSCSNSVIVNGSPDLVATKTNDTAGEAEIGVPFTWSIQVQNVGSANYEQNGGFNILRDELPDTNISYSAPSLSYAGGTSQVLGCSIDGAFELRCQDNDAFSMPPGGSFTVSVTATPTAAGVYANPRAGGVCSAGGEDLELDTSNNACADTVSIDAADIEVSKDDGLDTVAPGESTTYTITVTNNGPDDDPSVSLTDSFPSELTCTYTSVVMGGASGNTAAGSGDLAETLDMPAGSTVTYTANCDIDSAAIGTVSNTATVSGSIGDPLSGNDSATDETSLSPSADLAITKSDSADPIVVGDTLVYTISVENLGPSDATNVVVSDTLPSGVTLVSTSGCAQDPSGTPSCDLGTVAAGGTVNFSISVVVDAGAGDSLSNTASVSSDASDPVTGNNEDTEDTDVQIASALLLPESISFPNVVATQASAPEPLIVTSTGTAALDIAQVVIAGSGADAYDITLDQCSSQSIPTSQDCDLTLEFAPQTEGLKLAELRVISNDPNSPSVTELVGISVNEQNLFSDSFEGTSEP